jgi:hypothetical protein
MKNAMKDPMKNHHKFPFEKSNLGDTSRCFSQDLLAMDAQIKSAIAVGDAKWL